MVVNPAIVASVIAALASCLLLAYSAGFGWHLVRNWDLSSGSALQLGLERHTYLISTLVAFVFATEAASLLLFVYNADRIAPLFVGAMCAVGTLNTSPFGFPALLVKVLVFFAASTWLILHHLDTRGYDYPLTRLKYGLLFAVAPLVGVEAYLQIRFFLALDTDVITSCCGSLFGANREALGSELAGLPAGPAMALFYGVLGVTLAVGLATRRWPAASYAYAFLSALSFAVSLAAIVSFVSLYVYEHPHHHCPFCLLKSDYGYQGYLLYGPLFLATALGIGSGAVHLFARVPSLSRVVPPLVRRLTNASLGLFFFLVVWVCILTARSGLVLLGNEGV
jgi:hypothetical protein